MAAYRVTGRYTARRDGVTYGPWLAGDVVELTESDAEWIARDSDGVLAPVVEQAPARETPPPQPTVTKHDRQHRGGQKRW